jgi:acyl-CoA thioesterase-2
MGLDELDQNLPTSWRNSRRADSAPPTERGEELPAITALGDPCPAGEDGEMTNPLDELIKLLELERLEHRLFRGSSPGSGQQTRVFGGQVAAQALVAAARTVPDRAVHSLHAYFLREGDQSIPILYSVQHIRDGRSYTTRRVEAIQKGVVIFNLTASFHDPAGEEGFEHQDDLGGPPPDPETVPSLPARLSEWGIDAVPAAQLRLIDMRPIEFVDPLDPRPLPPVRRVWFRATGPLPEDPVLHACVVTYASDLYLLGTALLPHGVPPQSRSVSFASLDHAMWFHRPFRADEWLLHVQRTPSASRGRGLAHGSIYTRDGTLAVTVVQEGVLRRRRDGS